MCLEHLGEHCMFDCHFIHYNANRRGLMGARWGLEVLLSNSAIVSNKLNLVI